MQRYELAVIRRALTRVIRKVGPRRLRVTADRGFADVTLFRLLTELRVACVIRDKKSTKVWLDGGWRKLNTVRFVGKTRRRALGHLLYCARSSQALWITMSRKRDAKGQGGLWYLVASLATRLLLRGDTQARTLLRRVASRRRGRCELSLVSAMISLLHQEPGLYEHLAPRMKLKLDKDLAKVS
jgi:hypothetical protein